ncbi:hypothetical protein [Flavobacterium filum]|uniref:hypothetical protein n=1 Tax=Flavobacterium filum TaxID=370974 RepID=UPI0023F21146|nr:hypothetical protein [Flavobacterium filum]
MDGTIGLDKEIEDSPIAHSLDTTIFLTDIVKSNYTGQNLTSDYAKKILYAYFKSKGYYTSDSLPDDFSNLIESEYDKLNITYDTIFTTDLNGNPNLDAIITYWVAPPLANGHCWQPHKAIILDTDKGYKITNEEFMPDNFAIDSVITKKQSVIVYGYYYDCVNQEILRNIRVKLK